MLSTSVPCPDAFQLLHWPGVADCADMLLASTEKMDKATSMANEDTVVVAFLFI
jgi:hypothetical protein